MASLKEHAAARRAQTQLSRVDAETFKQAIQRTHERIAAEVWKGQTPPENELVAVVLDRLKDHGRLTDDEYARFSLLARDVKHRLALDALSPDEDEDEDDTED